MFEDASWTEIGWSLASALATLIHLYLTLQAFLDWQASRCDPRPDPSARQRGISAGWYMLGQFCLFLPKLGELAIGVYAMTVPNPRNVEIAEAATIAQAVLIAGEWIGAVGAVAFWLARRALAAAADRDEGG